MTCFFHSFPFKKDIYLTKMLKRRIVNKENIIKNTTPQSTQSNQIIERKDDDEYDDQKDDTVFTIDEQTKNKIKILNFDSLVLSAAGTNIFKTIAVLDYLHKNNKLQNINKFIGCSAGAILSLFLILDLTPFDIFEKLCQIQFEPLWARTNLSTLYTHSSLLSSNILIKIIQDIIIEKIGFDVSLAELFELTKKILIITVFNYSDYKIEYITHETHPHISCAEIVAASCAIPFVFSKLKIGNHFYIDGGVFDNFPLTYFLKKYPNSCIMAIVLQDDFFTKEQIEKRNNSSPLSYLIDIACIPNRLNTIKKIQKNKDKENICIITINSNPGDGLKFNMSYTDKCIIFSKTLKQFKKSL